MNRVKLVLIAGMLVLPINVFAQTQSKEPLLMQLFEDVSKARQTTEIELGACKVALKDTQQQLQVANEKKDVKEKK